MRTREDIEAKISAGEMSDYKRQNLMIELLLDIRDILVSKHPAGEPLPNKEY